MTTFYKSSMFPNIGHNNSPNIGCLLYIINTFLNILIRLQNIFNCHQ